MSARGEEHARFFEEEAQFAGEIPQISDPFRWPGKTEATSSFLQGRVAAGDNQSESPSPMPARESSAPWDSTSAAKCWSLER